MSIMPGATESATALSTMADSLPGMGIVAAVLGVVVTMSSLGGPPEEIGHKVAAALVGHISGHPALLWLGWSPGLRTSQNSSTMSTLLFMCCAW